MTRSIIHELSFPPSIAANRSGEYSVYLYAEEDVYTVVDDETLMGTFHNLQMAQHCFLKVCEERLSVYNLT